MLYCCAIDTKETQQRPQTTQLKLQVSTTFGTTFMSAGMNLRFICLFKSITKFVVTDSTSLEGNSTKATDYTTQTSGVNHIWPMQRRIIPNLSEDIPYFYFKRVTAEWKVRNGLWFWTKLIHISKIYWFKFRSCVLEKCEIDISYTYSIQKILATSVKHRNTVQFFFQILALLSRSLKDKSIEMESQNQMERGYSQRAFQWN